MLSKAPLWKSRQKRRSITSPACRETEKRREEKRREEKRREEKESEGASERGSAALQNQSADGAALSGSDWR